MAVHKIRRRLSSFQIIILGFAGVILIGALLLTLPIASAAREWTSFGDTLFTATSAVCVTGLVVQDTATYWSTFGQRRILPGPASHEVEAGVAERGNRMEEGHRNAGPAELRTEERKHRKRPQKLEQKDGLDGETHQMHNAAKLRRRDTVLQGAPLHK